MNIIYRPIDVWPGDSTPHHYRRTAPFRSTPGQTITLLEREIAHLGARDAVIQLAITEADLRLDGGLRASARTQHPGVIAAFDSRYGPLKYATDVFTTWQDNMRAIALGLESLRRVDRYGITKRGEQYAGWKALPVGGDVRRGIELIEIYGEARALRATHPDTRDPASGFTDEDFAAVQAGRASLIGEVA